MDNSTRIDIVEAKNFLRFHALGQTDNKRFEEIAALLNRLAADAEELEELKAEFSKLAQQARKLIDVFVAGTVSEQTKLQVKLADLINELETRFPWLER